MLRTFKKIDLFERSVYFDVEMVLPAPGEIVLHDFRDRVKPRNETGRELKVVQWNIERGYKLDGIIQELKKLDADIIGLQEIDIQCERSVYLEFYDFLSLVLEVGILM